MMSAAQDATLRAARRPAGACTTMTPTTTSWTGGRANRTWRAGSRIVPELAPDALVSAVREYRRACFKHAALLNPRYHPTADGAAKVIFTYSPADARRVREEFNRQEQA